MCRPVSLKIWLKNCLTGVVKQRLTCFPKCPKTTVTCPNVQWDSYTVVRHPVDIRHNLNEASAVWVSQMKWLVNKVQCLIASFCSHSSSAQKEPPHHLTSADEPGPIIVLTKSRIRCSKWKKEKELVRWPQKNQTCLSAVLIIQNTELCEGRTGQRKVLQAELNFPLGARNITEIRKCWTCHVETTWHDCCLSPKPRGKLICVSSWKSLVSLHSITV